MPGVSLGEDLLRIRKADPLESKKELKSSGAESSERPLDSRLNSLRTFDSRHELPSPYLLDWLPYQDYQ